MITGLRNRRKSNIGQVSMDIGEDMELIMGLRYVRERKVINADVCVSQDTLGISNCAGTTTNPYPVVQAILGSLIHGHTTSVTFKEKPITGCLLCN